MIDLFRNLRTGDSYLATIERWFIVVSLSLMVTGIFVESMSRWILNHGFPWMSEVTRFLMVYIGFLGASVATFEKKHISIDILNKVVGDNRKASLMLSAIASLASSIVLAYLSYACLVYFNSTGVQSRVTNALNMPIAVGVFIMPLGGALMTLRFLLIGFEDLLCALGVLPDSFSRVQGGIDELLSDAGRDGESLEATVDA